MLQEYSVNKCTRKCHVDGHSLEPGESYYSAIVPSGDEIIRVDISAQNWKDKPDGCIGWWKSRMPEAGPKKLKAAPNGVLLDTLAELVDRPGKESLAYLLALLLVRRQVLEETKTLDFEQSEELRGIDSEAATWALTCKADGRTWNIVVTDPTPIEISSLETELNGLLFTEE